MRKRQATKIVHRGSWDALRRDGSCRWRGRTMDEAVRLFMRGVGRDMRHVEEREARLVMERGRIDE